MPNYAFTASVNGLTADPEQLSRLFTETMSLVPGAIDGVSYLAVDLDADSDDDALHRLDCHLRSVAPEVTLARIDEDLVSTAEIAERAGVNREAVRLWATGQRREAFPAHRMVLSGGTKLWAWGDVFPWLREATLLGVEEPFPLSPEAIDWFNGQLVTRRREPGLADGELPSGWHAVGVATETHLFKVHVKKQLSMAFQRGLEGASLPEFSRIVLPATWVPSV